MIEIKKGNRFKGYVNGTIFEVLEIRKENTRTEYKLAFNNKTAFIPESHMRWLIKSKGIELIKGD